MEQLVPLLVALPLGAAFLIVMIAHAGPLKRLTTPLAVLAVLVNLLIAGRLLWAGALHVYVGGWGQGQTLGIELVCDGLSKLMLIVINFVALASIIFATQYMRRFTKVWLFDALFLLMTGAMSAVVLAGDMFNLFVFLEVAAIASYALVAFGCESEELEAAFKYLILGTVGSAFILLGVTILYSLTGHLNMAKISEALRTIGPDSPGVLLGGAAIIAGLALKAAMVPFHA
ncbi:MAG: NADH/ubiquinone/plastoquinone (complex I), partial [Phycisphaerae bacterium]|nr:NADH/ubiquinone/plastoquinone (complex I) [Phycisphaerae bacterium]